jgi:hypothetical protein
VVGDALSRLIAAEGHKQSTLAFNESENLACMHVETQCSNPSDNTGYRANHTRNYERSSHQF